MFFFETQCILVNKDVYINIITREYAVLTDGQMLEDRVQRTGRFLRLMAVMMMVMMTTTLYESLEEC